MIDKFSVNIGFAYYNSGFFNVRRKNSDLFGDHRSVIKIQLGQDSKNLVEGYVNRTANTNKTPRIMIGSKYTSWMKENFKEGGIFEVEVINSDFIKLTS